MERRQLVAAVAERIGDAQLANVAVTAFTETITDAVARGESVTIERFGRFRRVQRPARRRVPATHVPRFDVDAAFRDVMAGHVR